MFYEVHQKKNAITINFNVYMNDKNELKKYAKMIAINFILQKRSGIYE